MHPPGVGMLIMTLTLNTRLLVFPIIFEDVEACSDISDNSRTGVLKLFLLSSGGALICES